MTARLLPGPRRGAVSIPASKSQAHRLLLCGALGSRVKQGGGQDWTLETLQPVMGAFDIYLDA